MRTSVRWLNDYLTPAASAEEQADVLTDLGLPLDGREELEGGDVAQEIETTSNRGDCLCHIGLAREIAARTGRTLVDPCADLPLDDAPLDLAGFTLHNAEPALCPYYTARVIRGVKVGPSPTWLRDKLRAIGQVPRNNIVDATNFLLFETGQPSHVFDLATLKGNRLEVRLARAGESFLPLGDGAKEILLRSTDLVIADAERTVALAGVKGGALTAVRDSTVDILIEAATFDPLTVRATSRSHQLASDSSFRFERGVTPLQVDASAERLVQLIVSVAGGERIRGAARTGAPLPSLLQVSLRLAQIRRVLGIEVTALEATGALTALGFIVRQGEGTLECTVPPQRGDISREIDLIEEIARVVGYARLPVADRIGVRTTAPQPLVDGPRALRNLLAGIGYCECVTDTLVSPAAAAAFLSEGSATLRVDDERADAATALRTSLLPSLLRVARGNLDRGETEVRLFECASVFALCGNTHAERRMVTGISCAGKDQEEAYRSVRGVVERLVSRLMGPDSALTVSPSSAPGFDHCARFSARGHALGVAGLIGASARAAFGLERTVAAFEFDSTHLLCAFPPVPVAGEPPVFPAIDRDITAIVSDSTTWAEVESLVTRASLAHFESVAFITAFRGQNIGSGRKALSLRLHFRARERTLRREEVDPQIAAIVTALKETLKAEVRS
ncbi:MAG: phenylalanine--tRNA ligase subunit beta [Phycisphaerales bacterium]|nr:phenylalanine--tRNA ligase subunit beta [Phycisphaerales bacterium]